MPENNEQKDNVIFVGKKPSMVYVLAVMTQFGDGQKEVFIKARGQTISRAVDVAEIVRRRFDNTLILKNIELGTDELEKTIGERKGHKMNVSTISICLSK